jgi:hypothetical protein
MGRVWAGDVEAFTWTHLDLTYNTLMNTIVFYHCVHEGREGMFCAWVCAGCVEEQGWLSNGQSGMSNGQGAAR